MLALVSSKIYERFKDLLTAFRYFDTDHTMSLSLNEFAQGIEYLRIKIGFDDVKKLYNFLDKDLSGVISYGEFKLLSEENWRRFDPIVRYFEVKKHRMRLSKMKSVNSRKSETIDTPEESYKLQK